MIDKVSYQYIVVSSLLYSSSSLLTSTMVSVRILTVSIDVLQQVS